MATSTDRWTCPGCNHTVAGVPGLLRATRDRHDCPTPAPVKKGRRR